MFYEHNHLRKDMPCKDIKIEINFVTKKNLKFYGNGSLHMRKAFYTYSKVISEINLVKKYL